MHNAIHVKFNAILQTKIAQTIFTDAYIAEFVTTWRDENKAALLHANGINGDTPLNEALAIIKLVAAFGKKDTTLIHRYLYEEQLPAGCRLDYFLPLYDKNYDGGEDIFVAALNKMVQDTPHYVPLKNYVDSAFEIRALLKNAPNQTITKPTLWAIDAIIQSANTYRDSNQNPVMVCLPGFTSIPERSIETMIDQALQHGANINDVGLFQVPALVWAIILGDVAIVKHLLQAGASVMVSDDFGSANVLAWLQATKTLVMDNEDYQNRLNKIYNALGNQ